MRSSLFKPSPYISPNINGPLFYPQIQNLTRESSIRSARFDYTGFSDASRASIQMTHSANGPTVSLEEARRIEQETAAHLLKSQKLTLIVDLDQTIVHATVDPTVGDWISEGAAWEARQAKRRIEFEAKVKAQVKAKAETNGDGGGTGAATHAADGDGKEAGLSLQLEPDPNDEVNPNWEALKDVKKFRLGPEAFLPPTGIRPSGSRKGKERAIENDGCLYYVKPRCVPVAESFWLQSNNYLMTHLQTRMARVPQPRIH